MAKFTRKQLSLGPREKERLLIIFCQAIAEIKNPEEAANFIQDLLSEQEALMLAKRLAIAEKLINGEAYFDIQKSLRVSAGTVARVNTWLRESGEGYLITLQRIKKSGIHEITDAVPWKARRRRVTMYNWPSELVKEIILTGNKRQRERIVNTLKKLDSKSSIYKELNETMRNLYTNNNTTKY